MLQPARRKYRKEQKGRNKGVATRGNKVSFGEYGLKATDARPSDGAPDRSGAPRHDAPHQARRPHLDPHFPGQADFAEARGSAHGQRQGQSGVLGRRDPARAKCCTKWTAWTRRSAREAFRARSGQAAAADDVRAAHGRRLSHESRANYAARAPDELQTGAESICCARSSACACRSRPSSSPTTARSGRCAATSRACAPIMNEKARQS